MSYHVRDVLESVQDTAPAPHTTTDDIIARARRMRARRTAATVTGGAAAVVAVVLAAVAGLGGGPGAEEPPAAESVQSSLLTLPDGFRTVLGEYRVGAYQIGPVGTVTAGYQELPVYRDGQTWDAQNGQRYPQPDGTITFYRPGVYNTKALGTEEPRVTYGAAYPVTVAGRPGIGREVSYTRGQALGMPETSPTKYVRTALAWQYAPKAWATYVPQLNMRTQPAQDALDIAAEVTPQPARPIRTPYHLGVIPDGWQPVAVTETPAKLSSEVSDLYLHKGPVPKNALATTVDIRLPNALEIVVIKGQPKDDKIRGKNGVHCYSPGPACTIVVGDYFIDVEGRFSGLSDTEVRQLVLGLTPVDIASQDTWVPVGS
jgi:hypothetical protein